MLLFEEATVLQFSLEGQSAPVFLQRLLPRHESSTLSFVFFCRKTGASV